MPNIKGELLEADVRKQSMNYHKYVGLYHKRMHFGYGAAGGWPDDLFVFANAHHWWVEFKRPGGKASAKQAAVHKQMRLMGLDVSVIDSVEKFREEADKRRGMRP